VFELHQQNPHGLAVFGCSRPRPNRDPSASQPRPGKGCKVAGVRPLPVPKATCSPEDWAAFLASIDAGRRVRYGSDDWGDRARFMWDAVFSAAGEIGLRVRQIPGLVSLCEMVNQQDDPECSGTAYMNFAREIRLTGAAFGVLPDGTPLPEIATVLENEDQGDDVDELAKARAAKAERIAQMTVAE